MRRALHRRTSREKSRRKTVQYLFGIAIIPNKLCSLLAFSCHFSIRIRDWAITGTTTLGVGSIVWN